MFNFFRSLINHVKLRRWRRESILDSQTPWASFLVKILQNGGKIKYTPDGQLAFYYKTWDKMIFGSYGRSTCFSTSNPSREMLELALFFINDKHTVRKLLKYCIKIHDKELFVKYSKKLGNTLDSQFIAEVLSAHDYSNNVC